MEREYQADLCVAENVNEELMREVSVWKQKLSEMEADFERYREQSSERSSRVEAASQTEAGWRSVGKKGPRYNWGKGRWERRGSAVEELGKCRRRPGKGSALALRLRKLRAQLI